MCILYEEHKICYELWRIYVNKMYCYCVHVKKKNTITIIRWWLDLPCLLPKSLICSHCAFLVRSLSRNLILIPRKTYEQQHVTCAHHVKFIHYTQWSFSFTIWITVFMKFYKIVYNVFMTFQKHYVLRTL